MATAVLRSHDCLKHSLHQNFYSYRVPPPPMNPSTSRKKSSRSPPPRPNQARHVRPKANPVRSGRGNGSTNKENAEIPKKTHLVMGQVTLLKRGEELKPSSPRAAAPSEIVVDHASVLCSTNRLGPDPEILPKIADLKPVYAGDGYFAGPACVVHSPSPSSLPFPAFFLKKSADEASEMATKGLRCLLRLE